MNQKRDKKGRFLSPYFPDINWYDLWKDIKFKPQTLPAPVERRNAKPVLTWTDGYGVARTAKEMTSDHLLNVILYIRDKLKAVYGAGFLKRINKEAPFYFEAFRELKRRKEL